MAAASSWQFPVFKKQFKKTILYILIISVFMVYGSLDHQNAD